MGESISALNLKQDFEEALKCKDAARWTLKLIEPLAVTVALSSVLFPKEVFEARLLWAAYPDNPPSLKFQDPATGRLDMPTAWPVAKGFRPGNLDACVSWSSEGFSLHPEWRADPKFRWDSGGSVLLKVLRFLQDVLDETCAGRFRK